MDEFQLLWNVVVVCIVLYLLVDIVRMLAVDRRRKIEAAREEAAWRAQHKQYMDDLPERLRKSQERQVERVIADARQAELNYLRARELEQVKAAGRPAPPAPTPGPAAAPARPAAAMPASTTQSRPDDRWADTSPAPYAPTPSYFDTSSCSSSDSSSSSSSSDSSSSCSSD